MSEKIFRKVALERLSSPDQLDQLIQVTTRQGWLALLVLGVLIAGTITWGVTGSIPTKVKGRGILLKSGGVQSVVPTSGGKITDIAVSAGDVVEEGQVVARIAQPDLLAEIDRTRRKLKEIRKQHERLLAFTNQDTALRLDQLRRERQQSRGVIRTAEDRIAWLKKKIESQKSLLAEGLITREALLATEEKLFEVRKKVERAENAVKEIEIQRLQLENEQEKRITKSRSQIEETRTALRRLENNMDLASTVVSNHTGRILDVTTSIGSIVRTGEPIMRLNLIGKQVNDLQSVFFVQALEGKRIEAGMEVNISPSTVKREEYGVIRGRVTYVSEFPSTPESMMNVLGNSQLAQQLSGNGAPFEVYARLQIAPNTTSGYEWSSSGGPPMKIQSGTLCRTSVSVREQRPIELVIPKIREYLGV